jgi:hypothetical protein
MKVQASIGAIAVATALLAISVISCSGKATEAASSTEAVAAPSALPTGAEATLAGGWEAADIGDDAIQQAAWFAVKELGAKPEYKGLTIGAIKSAEQQVVAGMNYRLTFSFEKDGAATDLKVVVYRDLKDNMKVTEVGE